MKPPVKVQPSQPTLPGLVAPDPMLAYRARVDADIELIGAAATAKKRWALEESERVWAAQAEADPRRPDVFNPGDRVVYTAKFLQLFNGYRDIATVWTIQQCACELCELGNHVCTTEWSAGYDTFRHLSRAAIRHKGALHVDDVADGPLIGVPRAANTRWLNREDRRALGLPSDGKLK